MIKINLLPVRAEKRKEMLMVQGIISGTILVVSLIIFTGTFLNVKSSVGKVQTQIDISSNELAQLKTKIGKLDKIKEEKKKVQDKLDIVNKLEEAKEGPIRIFNILMEAKIAASDTSITSFSIGKKGMVIKGFAKDKKEIADLMKALQKYPEIGKVTLDTTKTKIGKKDEPTIVDFTLKVI